MLHPEAQFGALLDTLRINLGRIERSNVPNTVNGQADQRAARGMRHGLS